MSAPRLGRKLTLEEAQRVADGSGGYAVSWVPKGVLWAEVLAGGGREKAGESVTVSAVGYRITVRGAPEGAPSRPKPDQRFRDGTRIFRITAVAEADIYGLYLICQALEEVLS